MTLVALRLTTRPACADGPIGPNPKLPPGDVMTNVTVKLIAPRV